MEIKTQHQRDALIEALQASEPPITVQQTHTNGRVVIFSGVGTGHEETIQVGGFDTPPPHVGRNSNHGGPQEDLETPAERRARFHREHPELR